MRFSIDGDDHLLSDLGGRPFIEGFFQGQADHNWLRWQ